MAFAGVHAGKLKGYITKEILVDEGKLYASLMEVHKLYSPDGMPIMFDLQIEAEILGCELLFYDEIKDKADYVVYRYNKKEDIARTRKMGPTNLPAMVINGEPKFISIIPIRQELIEAINKIN